MPTAVAAGDRDPAEFARCTGLVALVYLGAGYDHLTASKHQATMRKAVGWMLAAEHPDGSFVAEMMSRPC